MKTESLNNIPEINSGDLREASEMLRATMTMLRQCYSIVWMRRLQFSDFDDSKIKEFSENFDKVQSVLYDTHNVLLNHYGAFVESEKSNNNGVPSSN